MRNSVKAIVDAHDGDVTLYLVDPTDPVAQAWSKAYPGLFTDGEEMPERIVEHLRYPQDLFRLQGQLYLEYHVTDPNLLFSGNDAWSLPRDPATISRDPALLGSGLLIGDRFDPTTNNYTYRAQILPYYLLTELPGESDLSYLLLQPFTPRDRRNMSSFLVADSTPGRYGRLIDFRMPQGELVEFVATDDIFTTNIAFGGPDRQDAYITLSGTGRLVKTRWARPGLQPQY